MFKAFYKILDNPKAYDFSQKLLGGQRNYVLIRKSIKDHLRQIKYTNVLDVGCGTGIFRNSFSGEYSGIDLNPAYIEKAKVNHKGNFTVGDATALAFGDETFNLVTTLGVTHHLNNQERVKMLAEMWRVCKKSGHILIVDGLVASNIWGYLLAKMDRGRYKMKYDKFKEMIKRAYPRKATFSFEKYQTFPHEFAMALIKKS